METNMMITQRSIGLFEKFCVDNGISGKLKDEKFELFKKLVEKVQYEPLEAIGIIAAHSISEPATQMSVVYDEKMIVKKDDVIKIVKIGEFVDGIVNLLGFRAEGWDVYDMSTDEIHVPSITDNEKIEWKRVLACSRHSAPKKLMKITTRSGREITATDSHSFVVRQNNSIVPVAGSNLNMGDRIPVMKYLPENCIQTLETEKLIDNKELLRNARKQLPRILELNEELGWIFGAYLAEGNATEFYTSFSNIDERFLERIRAFAKRVGFTFNEYDNFRGFAKGHDIRVNSTLLSHIMKTACNTGSANKKLPSFAYGAKPDFVAGLLKGYFDGDGSVSETRGIIRISSKSKELIDGIALLLTRFGIFAVKSHGKENCIVIYQKYASIFKEMIGFTIEKKMTALEKICKKTEQDFIDMISGFGSLFHDTAKKLDYPTRHINSFTKRQKIGREVLFKHIRVFEGLAKEKNVDIDKELSVMKQMAYSDVVWDEIVSIEETNTDSEYVYDFTVEGTETFTTFDGIITHNTMRTYTLATQKDRLSKVTQGLPRLIEIFDAKKTLEKQMKIFLLPEYNTKEKARAVAMVIKSKKVRDIIISDSLDLAEMKIELELESEDDKEKILKLLERAKADISSRGKKIFIAPKKHDVRAMRKLHAKLLDAHVSGIKGIEEVVVVKDGEEWMIQTAGTNLKKILHVDGVDISRTTTNDLYQVHEVLGIEAARCIILNDTKTTLSEQGLDIDIRHLCLLADVMTVDGDVKAIGRYGVSGAKASVLARANFEETKKHLVNASFNGEKDRFSGVIENVMIGQIVPVGTGGVKLSVDVEKLIKNKGA